MKKIMIMHEQKANLEIQIELLKIFDNKDFI